MARTIVGLYDTHAVAQQVVDELVDNDFSDSDIEVTDQDTNHSTLMDNLTDGGVPQEDAEYYAEGVRRGGVLVIVSAADDQAELAADVMRREDVVDIEARASRWRESGWTGYDRNAAPYTADQTAAERDLYRTDTGLEARGATGNEVKVPVTEEKLKVGKRAVHTGGGVRVHTRITEEPVEEKVSLREEHVSVERRPVDRPVSGADRQAFKEGVVEVDEVQEEPVVSKEARVVEEVTVRKEDTEREETVRDKVRRTEVEVDKTGSSTSGDRTRR